MERSVAVEHLTDLMTLRAVVLHGRVESAAAALRVNRTTVGRRIQALETALGGRVLLRGSAGIEVTPLGERALATADRLDAALEGLCTDEPSDRVSGVIRVGMPEGFATFFGADALASLVVANPGLRVELRTTHHRTRLSQADQDLEVTVGRPRAGRALTRLIRPYRLRLYATQEYLDRRGTPPSVEALAEHHLIYYVESDATIGALDEAREALPAMAQSVASTSVHAHIAATLAGAGIGLLPDVAADRSPRLLPVLEEFSVEMEYWLVARPEAWRNPAVRAVHDALLGEETGR